MFLRVFSLSQPLLYAPLLLHRYAKLGLYSDCPEIALQVGCEGGYCEGVGLYQSFVEYFMNYPVSSPRTRLRVKVLAGGSETKLWAISFGDAITYDTQTQTEWLNTDVPDSASSVGLYTSCRQMHNRRDSTMQA